MVSYKLTIEPPQKAWGNIATQQPKQKQTHILCWREVRFQLVLLKSEVRAPLDQNGMASYRWLLEKWPSGSS